MADKRENNAKRQRLSELPSEDQKKFIVGTVQAKLDTLVGDKYYAQLAECFRRNGPTIVNSYHVPAAIDEHVTWTDETPCPNLQNYHKTILAGHISEAFEISMEEHFKALRMKLCSSPLTNVVDWDIAKKVENYYTDARSWQVGKTADASDLKAHMANLAAVKNDVDKQLQYIAFTGSSGSGKTTAMIYSALNEYKTEDEKLTVYLQTGRRPNPSGDYFDTSPAFDLLNEEVNMFYNVINAAVSKVAPVVKVALPPNFWKETKLVLVLDEVPNHWTHEHFLELPRKLRDVFAGVVLMVGSTALSDSVLQQPTVPLQMIKVQMRPVEQDKAKLLLRVRVTERFDEWWKAFPLLTALITNQRCAEVTAEVLNDITAGLAEKTPEDKAVEHFASMTTYVMLRVAQKYLKMNGIQKLDYSQRILLMVSSLGLVSMQTAVKQDAEGAIVRGVRDNVYKRVIPKDGIAVCTKGLVDRQTDCDTVDKGFLEWTMSPALTLVCAVTLAPWFAELHHEPDKLEALSCLQWQAIRYMQTEEIWTLQRMQKAVPMTGTDKARFKVEGNTTDSIFLNAPMASFGDTMVAAVQPKAQKSQNGGSPADRKTTSRDQVPETPNRQRVQRAAQVVTPRHMTENSASLEANLFRSMIVQAKHTFTTSPDCNVVSEMAKAGTRKPIREDVGLPKLVEAKRKLEEKKEGAAEAELTRHNEKIKQAEDRLLKLEQMYESGSQLTSSDGQFENATMVFLTNKKFKEDTKNKMLEFGCLVVEGATENVEGTKSFEFDTCAWQHFYPFSQLCLPKSPSNKVGRVECSD